VEEFIVEFDDDLARPVLEHILFVFLGGGKDAPFKHDRGFVASLEGFGHSVCGGDSAGPLERAGLSRRGRAFESGEGRSGKNESESRSYEDAHAVLLWMMG
jgi:hypothetical protein